MIQVTVDSVRVSLLTQNRVVVLRETESRRYLPIWIGQFEADAISFVLQNLTPTRPMTHDLLRTVFAELDGELEHVLINDIQETTFYAQIHVRTAHKTLVLDARTSDAIAVALRAHIPIYVASHVFDQASVPFDGDEQQEPPLFRTNPTSDSEPAEASDAAAAAPDAPVSDEGLSMFRDFINSLDEDEDPDKKPPSA
ncbi:MAG: hypothetical protein RLZZ297_2000 [Chloroflexota bacterium]|jgi:bifunctional DNase/RNase